MTLDEAVLEHIGDDIYVGCASNFIWIGDAETYDKEIDEVSEEYTRKLKRYVRKKEFALESLLKASAKDKAYIDNLGESIATERKRLERATNEMERFVPFRQRQVKEIYKRSLGGYAIIIRGNEHGSYWTKEEWKETHNEN